MADWSRRIPAGSFEVLAGRVLIAVLFAAGTVQKIVDPGAAEGLLAGFRLPTLLIYPAIVFNAAVAVLLVTGHALVPVARLAALYCLVTSAFHFVPDDGWQMSILIKNWAIAGGLFCIAALSRGRNEVP